MIEFRKFSKIPRWNRRMIITEKIDGTNASVIVHENGLVQAASKNHLITVADDHYGFAAWVAEHAEELRQLGPGQHSGEWWGRGINRGYGLDHRRFSLFNIKRWTSWIRPGWVCDVVPVLDICLPEHANAIPRVLEALRYHGSYAAPGFKQPEGIVIFHTAANRMFKMTLENDDQPKDEQ